MKTTRDYLNCPMEPNDSGHETVGGYLTALLVTLFEEGEGFSGKRPFGNSGWESDVANAWLRAGLLPAKAAFLDVLSDVLSARLAEQ